MAHSRLVDWEKCLAVQLTGVDKEATGNDAGDDDDDEPNFNDVWNGFDGDISNDNDNDRVGCEDGSGNLDENIDNADDSIELNSDPYGFPAHQERLLRLKHFKAFIADTGKYIPKPEKDNFAPLGSNSARTIVKNDTTAFALTVRITYRKRSLDNVSELYQLPSLLDSILLYYGCREQIQLPFAVVDCWSKVRLQLRTTQNERVVASPHTVAALPPTDALPYGFCNFVLIKDPPNVPYRGIQGAGNSHYVAQIRLIFSPFVRRPRRGAGVTNTRHLLAYVQPLKPARGTLSLQDDGRFDHVPDDNIEMFRLVRDLNPDGSRVGKVVRLLEIWRPIDVIPVFGEECPEEWNRDNSVELATEFYVNSFADKETYQAVY
ncbi:hypothetical protein SCHPADRAFT_944890 [Schizopora paradoxa]|uniref:DUF6830 domain-containing protein n=1 Tax=Schizopora paradoxa TaxID=27342 RepID=A0A0H2RSY1_9AGAM|nr:hypothetical protein SCHPADRAFT_944890 [Schizopora paradoxa]